MIAKLTAALTQEFAPDFLDITDESYRHRGHVGFEAGKITHLKISIGAVSLSFLPPLERHRRVYKAVEKSVGSIHSISIKIV